MGRSDLTCFFQAEFAVEVCGFLQVLFRAGHVKSPESASTQTCLQFQDSCITIYSIYICMLRISPKLQRT